MTSVFFVQESIISLLNLKTHLPYFPSKEYQGQANTSSGMSDVDYKIEWSDVKITTQKLRFGRT